MMVNNQVRNEYRPRYASPPGETLEEVLEMRGMTQADLARRTGRPTKTINEIIKGKTAITPETALQLERVLGIPAGFWMKREQHYRESLARQDEEEALSDQIGWLEKFPVKEMISNGWIEKYKDKVQQLRALLNFFGIASPEQWMDVYENTAFRQSQAFEVNPFAVAAWLRRGELIAQQIPCETFDRKQFEEVLRHIRGLTVNLSRGFDQTVVELCATAGVAVAFVPQLPKTRVSGATRWLTPEKALIQLSLRYKRDDHLWFTFFHEAGHILLHGKRDVFLEEEGLEHPTWNDKEREANRFAADFLIPPHEWNRLVESLNAVPSGRYPSLAALERFAYEIGVSPGIVIGRLQHEQMVPYTHFNRLKTRLEWS